MSEIKDRIIGTEMEYAVMASARGKLEMSQVTRPEIKHFFRQSFDSLGIAYTGTGDEHFFLSNGARCYGDIGDRREYATPEDTEIVGTLANEIAGEEITQKAASLFARKRSLSTSVSKRVLDGQETSAGYHINLSAEAGKVNITPEGLALYGVFAAVRGALFGAGAMGSGGRFIVAQKASHLETDFSGETTKKKPVVNLRNQPESDIEKWVRVHDTSGDPTMSPWATMTKLGAASIVLRLIENDRTMSKLRFKDQPLHEIAREVASDPELKKRFKMVSGESLSAVEVMGRIVKEAQLLEKEGGLSPSEQAALPEWDQALSDIAQDPTLVKSRVEWIAKLALLKRYRERVGCDWESPLVRRVDYLFSDLSDNGLGIKMRQAQWADYMPDQALITSRVTTPPSTTRARIRGTAILDHATNTCKAHLNAGWNFVTHGGTTRHIDNPFATSHTELDQVCKMSA